MEANETHEKPILKEIADFTLPNGLVIQIGPLQQESFENLNKWIRRRYLQNIRSVLADFPIDEQEKLLNRAVKDAALMSVKTEEGLQVLYESINGYARLCYEMIKNPTISFEEFCKIVFPNDNEYGAYADVLHDMFFTVYDKMFMDNVTQMFTEEVLEEMGVVNTGSVNIKNAEESK